MEEETRFGPRIGGLGRPERGFSTPKPVSIGKEYGMNIEELSSRPEGIAKVQGPTVSCQTPSRVSTSSTIRF